MTTAVLGDTREATSARHWIDGRWRDSAEHEDSIDPATGEVIGRYAVGGENDAQEAAAAALRAFRETTWRNDRALRSRALHEMAECFDARAAELIRLLSVENGKVVPEATFEVRTAAPALRHYGALVLTEYGRVAEWERAHISLLAREPIGVAGISVPFHSPVTLLIRSLAPALAAGCTTVALMPAETAQLNALVSDVISGVTALPPGVVNVLTGERQVLNVLVNSPDVHAIRSSARTSGKPPILVFDDADLDAALPKLEKAVTVFAGQFCTNARRLLVQSGIAERVRHQLAARLTNVKVGPASDPTSDMGPLIDKACVERVDRMVEDALAAGAKAIVRGGRVSEEPLARGAFYRPTFIEVTDSRLPIVQEELFGPVITMQVFETEAEALALANNRDYGLTAGIWTRDVDRPLRIGRDLQVGTLWVNDWAMLRDEFEDAGFNQSARGRQRALAALDGFLHAKYIVLKPGVAGAARPGNSQAPG